MKIDRMIPDSSVMIEGLLSRKISEKKIEVSEIIIHEALVAALEINAKENKVVGLLGIGELSRLKSMESEHGFILRFSGMRPRRTDILNMDFSEVDSLLRDLSYDSDSTFYTIDRVQADIARAKGGKAFLEEQPLQKKKLRLDSYFDENTMSVHLRENVRPYAKKGMPGSWSFDAVGGEKLTTDDVQKISTEIIEEAKKRKDSFIEIERPGSTIVQLGSYRIVITKPPFSDGWEITAVRPVKKLVLDDYSLSEKMKDRIIQKAEGMLIAGAPGMGKSTFAAALAEHYADLGKIVKTVEAPRDLVLPDKITQYAISYADSQEIHDILLLSRPDYTFFDEMRNTADFRLFSDLRLAGIGFIGVVHATNPVDAIQRFVGRIELGVIPQVVDTVIFIKDGAIAKVLSLMMVVKVPAGMTESDLARPIVVVNDFETNKPEYELYSYGEETVVVPVSAAKDKNSPALEIAARQIEHEMKKYSKQCRVEMVSEHKCMVFVPEEYISKIIGKQGKNIAEIEKQIGIGIDVRALDEVAVKESSGISGEKAGRQGADFDVRMVKKSLILELDPKLANRNVIVLIKGDELLSAKVSKKGQVKVKMNNRIGRILADAVNMGEDVKVVLVKD